LQRFAQQRGLAKVVYTSDLQRCRAVGRYLRRLGWRHEVWPSLREMDFGAWTGQPWTQVEQAEWAAWEAEFADYRCGERGESVRQLLARVEQSVANVPDHALVVTHAGWLQALGWLEYNPLRGNPLIGNTLSSLQATELMMAAWPTAPKYASYISFSLYNSVAHN
jgi:alpha-ribazole phosphatase